MAESATPMIMVTVEEYERLQRELAEAEKDAERNRNLAAEVVTQRAENSVDANYFRWLVKNHSGTDGKRVWIGGIDFNGTDIREAIAKAKGEPWESLPAK